MPLIRTADPSTDVTGDQEGTFDMLDRAICIWLTGLPASGKSTLALNLHRQLVGLQNAAVILDGDLLREGINSDLGFDAASRRGSVRRAGEIARLLVSSGVFGVASLISPYRQDRVRVRVRQRFEPGRFVEIFVDTPLAGSEARDPKGLYQKARKGDLVGLTGIDAPYEKPTSPEIHLTFDGRSSHEVAGFVIAEIGRLREQGRL